MAILKPKRGSGLPTSLQQNELAVDILNKRIYLGNAGGTGDIVSSHITDYVISANGATGAVTILGGTGISVISPSGASKGITLVNQGVLSLNGSTGAVTNVALTNTAQTFTALQSFSSGISASGGTFSGFIRFNSGLSSAGGTFTALTRFTSGLSASGATFTGDVNFSALNGRIIANNQLDITGKGIYLQAISTNAFVDPSIINLPNDGTSLFISCGNGTLEFFNSNTTSIAKTTTLSFNTFQSLGLDEYYSKFSIGPQVDPATNLNYNAYLPADTGTIALTKNVVSSFNGFTGAVTGVTTGTANIFGPLQSFTNGISASGGTFTSILIRNSGNTLTTTITAPSTASTNKTITFPNRSGTVALEHSSGPIISDAGGDIVINPFGMTINNLPSTTNLGPTGSTAFMLHLNPFEIPKGSTLTRVLTMQGAPCTGHTGSLIFAVYDTGITNGLPNNLVYASASTQITKTDYQRYTAAPNVYLNAGSYWIGYLMDRTGVTQSMSWATVAGKAHSWDAFANGGRLFNNGQMATIRYRLSGFTLASQLTAGFTSAINSNTNPAIGFGNSETYYDNNSPWVGISVQQ